MVKHHYVSNERARLTGSKAIHKMHSQRQLAQVVQKGHLETASPTPPNLFGLVIPGHPRPTFNCWVQLWRVEGPTETIRLFTSLHPHPALTTFIQFQQRVGFPHPTLLLGWASLWIDSSTPQAWCNPTNVFQRGEARGSDTWGLGDLPKRSRFVYRSLSLRLAIPWSQSEP